jgi:hypothetical protein
MGVSYEIRNGEGVLIARLRVKKVKYVMSNPVPYPLCEEVRFKLLQFEKDEFESGYEPMFPSGTYRSGYASFFPLYLLRM